MNKEDTFSCPSEIFSGDIHEEILNCIGDNHVQAMNDLLNDPGTLTVNSDLEDFKDFKQDFVVTEIPPNILPIVPVLTNNLSNEEYPGPYDFEVGIYPNGSKNPWVFSHHLNKIYMDMLNPFPVDFKIKNRLHNVNLLIRVTPQYSQAQYSQDLVYRCIQHEHPLDPQNRSVEEHVCQHIIRCKNANSMYCGNKNKNEPLSVVIPFSFPQTGAETVREMFHFVCKNSCPTPGMNRRPIEIIFTLEDYNGQVLGRHSLNVRICSCPKRDKEKEEKEFLKDKPAAALPRGKKRKMEKSEKKIIPVNGEDTKKYTLNVEIVGKHNYLQALKYIADTMAGEILLRANNSNSGNSAIYKECYEKVNAQRNKPLD